MKYKTKNLFDDKEETNSYIEIDESNNRAKIVEDSIEKEAIKKKLADLTISSAMEKYFYPKYEIVDAVVEHAESYRKQQEKEFPEKPKRKHNVLRIIFETILTFGIATAVVFGHRHFMEFFSLFNAYTIGTLAVAVAGLTIAATDSIFYSISSKRKKKLFEKHLLSAVELVKCDQQQINRFLNKIEKFKENTDMENYIFTGEALKSQCALADINCELYKLISAFYDISANAKMVELTEKYKNLSNCYQDLNMLMKDYNEVRKILPTLKISVPKTVVEEEKNMIYSSRVEYAKLVEKTFIPFTQVFIATYDKAYANYIELVRKENEARKREEQLRKEMKQKKYDQENHIYKKFFDNYGIDAELDQDDLTK